MRRVAYILGVMMIVVMLPGVVGATGYTFQPSDTGDRDDLFDLDHDTPVSWGIDSSAIDLTTETITSATLHFDNIRNWRDEDNDLYVRLFDYFTFTSNTAGVTTYTERRWSRGDYFAREGGIRLVHYEDLSTVPQDLTYEFTADQLTALSDYLDYDFFGLTFDADCHYWNDGVSLEIETNLIPETVVPEPGTLLLISLGLLGSIAIGRKRRK